MIDLDDLKIHQKIDRSGMYSKIIHLPEQVLKAYEEVKKHQSDKITEADKNKIDNIVICGMGGSAISGDIARVCFGNLLPVQVIKDYQIPYLNKNSLVIPISYSGDTEETLSCLQQALKITSHIAAITSGGKLKELISDKFYWIELESGMPPRSAIGLLFFSLVRILEDFGIIQDQSGVVKKIVADLIKKANSLCLANPVEMNIAKNSATLIKGKVPLIYPAAPQLQPLAYRWKCQINENAKYPSFTHAFPEMNHNEIEGWEHTAHNNSFIPIFLKRMQEEEKYNKRITAFKQILNREKIEYLEFYLEGESLMQQIFSLIYLGDMISYYLAVLEGTDPTEIENINFLKKAIS